MTDFFVPATATAAEASALWVRFRLAGPLFTAEDIRAHRRTRAGAPGLRRTSAADAGLISHAQVDEVAAGVLADLTEKAFDRPVFVSPRTDPLRRQLTLAAVDQEGLARWGVFDAWHAEINTEQVRIRPEDGACEARIWPLQQDLDLTMVSAKLEADLVWAPALAMANRIVGWHQSNTLGSQARLRPWAERDPWDGRTLTEQQLVVMLIAMAIRAESDTATLEFGRQVPPDLLQVRPVRMHLSSPQTIADLLVRVPRPLNTYGGILHDELDINLDRRHELVVLAGRALDAYGAVCRTDPHRPDGPPPDLICLGTRTDLLDAVPARSAVLPLPQPGSGHAETAVER